MSITKSCYKALGFENLESRQLLASISLNGTNADNRVAIVENSDDTITIGNLESTGRTNKEGNPILAFRAIRVRGEDSQKIKKDGLSHITFKGLGGNDLVLNMTSVKLIAYGGDGRDVLVGGSASDILYGGSNNDLLDGRGGDDQLYGDSGKTKSGGRKPGHDVLIGGIGQDKLIGQDGHDILLGGRDKDTMEGNAGFDALDGGLHDDTMSGGSGNDLIFGRRGEDKIEGGANDDYLDGGTNNDTMKGDAGLDCLFGRLGADDMRGGNGADYLSTGRIGQKDKASGDGGNDIVFGFQADQDVLVGELIHQGSGELAGKKNLSPEERRCTLDNFQITFGGENPHYANGKRREIPGYPEIQFPSKTEDTSDEAYYDLLAYVSPRLSQGIIAAEAFSPVDSSASLMLELLADERFGEDHVANGQELGDAQLIDALFLHGIQEFDRQLESLIAQHQDLVADLELLSEFPDVEPELRPRYAHLLSPGQELREYLEAVVAHVELEFDQLAQSQQNASLFAQFFANIESEAPSGDELHVSSVSEAEFPEESSAPEILELILTPEGIDLGKDWSVEEPISTAQGMHHVLVKGAHRIESVQWNDLQNPIFALDVNHDGYSTPIDVLLVVNHLNNSDALLNSSTGAHHYLDSSGDGFITALDALLIINRLNSDNGLAEAESTSDEIESSPLLFGIPMDWNPLKKKTRFF